MIICTYFQDKTNTKRARERGEEKLYICVKVQININHHI